MGPACWHWLRALSWEGTAYWEGVHLLGWTVIFSLLRLFLQKLAQNFFLILLADLLRHPRIQIVKLLFLNVSQTINSIS